MKKIISGILLLVIILFNAVSVNAMEFEELGMKIEIPNQYYDLKSGIDNNDSKITFYETVLKTTKDDLKNQYEQSGVIYSGITNNLSTEIIISVVENNRTKSDFNLSLLKEENIKKLQQELIEANKGMQKQSQEIYEKNGIKYVYTVFKNVGTTLYQYYTIVNGKAITITLNSKFSNVKNDELKTIVDTIEFSQIEEKPFSILNNPYILIGAAIGLIIVIIIWIIVLSITNRKEN